MLQHPYGVLLASDSDEANQDSKASSAFWNDVWNDTPLVEFDRPVETLLECGDEIFAQDIDRRI